MYQIVDGDGIKGRAAVAARPIAAGRCLVRTQAHTAVSLRGCACCFSTTASLQRCSGCRIVRYCSRRCQQEDWISGGHGSECAAWRLIPAGRASQTVLLVARLAARCLLQDPFASSTQELLALRHHVDDHTAGQLHEFEAMTQLVLSILVRSKWNRSAFSMDAMRDRFEREIVRLFCRVNCNAFTICDDVNVPLGIGMFPAAAMLNHSCAPNCVVSFEAKGSLRIHVIRPVGKGEELTISYVELVESTARRRQALRASYFFECTCDRCNDASVREDWWLDGFICKQSSCQGEDSVVVMVAGVGRCMACGVEQEVIEVPAIDVDAIINDSTLPVLERWRRLEHEWKQITEATGYHPRSTRVAVTARALGNFIIDHGEVLNLGTSTKMAFGYLQCELLATEWVLPSWALPSRGLLHFQLAKLSAKLGDRDAASHHIRQALSILSCASSSDSAIVQSAAEFLRELQHT